MINIRKAEIGDYEKGHLELLSQLTTVGVISRAQYAINLEHINTSSDQTILVAVEALTGRLVGSGTLLIEQKLIHGCGKVGHIEDVVIDKTCRGQEMGQRIVEALVALSRKSGCYKVILDCSEANASFYEKCGLVRKGVQMAQYFDH